MDELKITKEAVVEAAGKCEKAKETLKILFPEAFEFEYKYLNYIAQDEKAKRSMREFINDINYDVYKRIPGYSSYEKREAVAKVILEHWGSESND